MNSRKALQGPQARDQHHKQCTPSFPSRTIAKALFFRPTLKAAVTTAFLFSCLLSALTLTASAQAPTLSDLDIVERSVPAGPVALVYGEAISRDDFLFLYRNQLAAVLLQARGEAIEDSVRVKTGLRTLGELVQREILWTEAKKRQLTVDDATLKSAYEQKLELLQKRMARGGAATPTEEMVLKTAGQTKAEAMESLRKSLLVEKAWEAIAKEKKISVSDSDIKAFYDGHLDWFKQPSQVHLRQIFVHPKPSAKEADDTAWAVAEKAMKKALARIRAGESFEAVAKSVSESPDAGKGGDMGLLPTTQLPEFFRLALEKMKPGDMSSVIRSDIGMHLIRLEERTDAGKIALEEAQDRIRQLLHEAKTEEAVARLCEPIVNDPEQVQIFLQLEQTLSNMMVDSAS